MLVIDLPMCNFYSHSTRARLHYSRPAAGSGRRSWAAESKAGAGAARPMLAVAAPGNTDLAGPQPPPVLTRRGRQFGGAAGAYSAAAAGREVRAPCSDPKRAPLSRPQITPPRHAPLPRPFVTPPFHAPLPPRHAPFSRPFYTFPCHTFSHAPCRAPTAPPLHAESQAPSRAARRRPPQTRAAQGGRGGDEPDRLRAALLPHASVATRAVPSTAGPGPPPARLGPHAPRPGGTQGANHARPSPRAEPANHAARGPPSSQPTARPARSPPRRRMRRASSREATARGGR